MYTAASRRRSVCDAGVTKCRKTCKNYSNMGRETIVEKIKRYLSDLGWWIYIRFGFEGNEDVWWDMKDSEYRMNGWKPPEDVPKE